MDVHRARQTKEDVMNDPKDPESARSQEAWSQLADQFTQIGRQFRQHYERVSAANQPSTDKTQGSVEHAVTVVGKAVEDTARTIGSSVRDPKVREDTGQAGSALLRAVGATLAELGVALQREADPGKKAKSETASDAAEPAEPKEIDSADPAAYTPPSQAAPESPSPPEPGPGSTPTTPPPAEGS
jgi:hypothetical protein